MAAQGRGKGQDIKAALRRVESLKYRLKGLSWREIGKRVDVSHVQALNDVKQILRETLSLATDEAEEMRELENMRLDALWAVFYPMVVNRGDIEVAIDSDTVLDAAQKCLQISKARRELNGLDAPVKVELGGNVGLHPVQDRLKDLTDEQLIGLSGVGIKPQLKLIKKPK